jgi:hypothetical protein
VDRCRPALSGSWRPPSTPRYRAGGAGEFACARDLHGDRSLPDELLSCAGAAQRTLAAAWDARLKRSARSRSRPLAGSAVTATCERARRSSPRAGGPASGEWLRISRPVGTALPPGVTGHASTGAGPALSGADVAGSRHSERGWRAPWRARCTLSDFPRQIMLRSAAFESACGGSTPPGAIPNLLQMHEIACCFVP